MSIIFVSSDTAPLNAVIICCTAVTALNMFPRGKFFIFGARTVWPVSCCWRCCEGARALDSSSVAGPAAATWRGRSCCCCFALFHSSAHSPDVMQLEENTLHVMVLGVLCDFLSRISSFSWLQPRCLNGCCFSSSARLQLHHAAVYVSLPASRLSLHRWPPPHYKICSSYNIVYGYSELCTPLPCLQCDKGFSVWRYHVISLSWAMWEGRVGGLLS
jgi:hypothetical protein